MNKTHQILWSQAQGKLVVASELSKSKKKSTKKGIARTAKFFTSLFISSGVWLSSPLFAESKGPAGISEKAGFSRVNPVVDERKGTSNEGSPNINAFTHQVEEHARELDKHRVALDVHGQKINSHNEKLDKHQRDLEVLNREVEQAKGVMENSSRALRDTEETVSLHTEDLKGINNTITGHKAVFAATDRRVEGLETTSIEQGKKITAAETTLAEHKQAIQENKQTIQNTAQVLAAKQGKTLAAVVEAFGGGVQYDETTGAISVPVYSVDQKSHKGIQNTIDALDKNFKELKELTEENQGKLNHQDYKIDEQTKKIKLAEVNHNEKLDKHQRDLEVLNREVEQARGVMENSSRALRDMEETVSLHTEDLKGINNTITEHKAVFAATDSRVKGLETSSIEQGKKIAAAETTLTEHKQAIQENKETIQNTAQALAAKQGKTLTAVVEAFGGGVQYDETTGAISVPVYSVDQKSHKGIQNTIDALDKNFKELKELTEGNQGKLNHQDYKIDEQTKKITQAEVNMAHLQADVQNSGKEIALTKIEVSELQAKARQQDEDIEMTKSIQENTGVSLAGNLGGGAKYDPKTGKTSSPQYVVDQKNYTTVEATFQAVDSVLRNNRKLAKETQEVTQATQHRLDQQEYMFGKQKEQFEEIQKNTMRLETNDQRQANDIAQSKVEVANLQSTVIAQDRKVEAVAGIVDTHSAKLNHLNIQANSTTEDAGKYSMAIGKNAKARGNGSQAFGSNATASGMHSTAVGTGSTDNGRANVFSVGSGGVGNTACPDGICSPRPCLDDSCGPDDADFPPPPAHRQIINVAPGTAPNDAVNLAQLQEVKGQLHNLEKKAYAGIAAAMAMASLPHATVPGKNMTAIGVSNHQGESAVAVSVSKMSPDSKWIFKLQGTANTRGQHSVGAGVGFHW